MSFTNITTRVNTNHRYDFSQQNYVKKLYHALRSVIFKTFPLTKKIKEKQERKKIRYRKKNERSPLLSKSTLYPVKYVVWGSPDQCLRNPTASSFSAFSHLKKFAFIPKPTHFQNHRFPFPNTSKKNNQNVLLGPREGAALGGGLSGRHRNGGSLRGVRPPSVGAPILHQQRHPQHVLALLPGHNPNHRRDGRPRQQPNLRSRGNLPQLQNLSHHTETQGE